MLEICPPNEISVNVIYRNKYLGWPFIGNFFGNRDYDRIIALCIFLTEDANETRSISERILLLGYKRKKKKFKNSKNDRLVLSLRSDLTAPLKRRTVDRKGTRMHTYARAPSFFFSFIPKQS